jgi:hypothetical protein
MTRFMRVLIFEPNLMWSSRLVQSIRKLGHEPLLRTSMPEVSEGAQAAIVNLGEVKLDPSALVAKLKDLGVSVIAHAGHKEKELLELGRDAGVEILATNSQLTYKLDQLLEQVILPD